MEKFVVLILVGTCGIVAGIVTIKFRQRIARTTAEAQRNYFGRIANASARKSTPANALFVGIVAILMGIVFLVFAVLGVS